MHCKFIFFAPLKHRIKTNTSVRSKCTLMVFYRSAMLRQHLAVQLAPVQALDAPKTTWRGRLVPVLLLLLRVVIGVVVVKCGVVQRGRMVRVQLGVDEVVHFVGMRCLLREAELCILRERQGQARACAGRGLSMWLSMLRLEVESGAAGPQRPFLVDQPLVFYCVVKGRRGDT